MSDEDLPGALANLLTRRCDPLIQALRDAMSVPGANDGSALLQGLLILDRLGGAAGAARKQFEQSLARERASGKDAAARSPMRELGLALIDTWVAFTGKPPRFSRPSDGGAPSGPLIRYLICLFARARNNLAAQPERHELAPGRRWSPAPETLAAWIRQHRRTA
jgi:hypothetical protein